MDRQLNIGIDGDDQGLERAFQQAETSARGLDRELGRLERQQVATEYGTRRISEAVQRYGRDQDRAGEAARRAGTVAREAAQRAERAIQQAADAADQLARGEISAEQATQRAAAAEREIERAAMAAAAAHRAAGQAAEQQAQEERRLAREAELAGAKQRLAQLRAAGATKEHDRLLTHLRARFGDLGKDGDSAFTMIGDSANKSGGLLTKLGGGPLPMIAAALGALPWAASLAGSAITVGLGAAIIGVGIKAAASNAKVKTSYSDLGKHVKSEAKTWAKPFEDTLIKTAGFARRTFDELGPDLKEVWAELAPVTTAFADDFMHSLEEFRPAIHDVSEAFGPLLSTLGGEMPGLMGRLADTISRVAKSADPEMFGRMITGVGLLITGAGHAIAILSKLADVFYRFGPISLVARNVDDFGRGLDALRTKAFGGSRAVDSYARSTASVGVGTILAAAATTALGAQTATASGQVGTMSGAMRMASQTAEQLKASLDKLAGKTLGLRQASSNYQAAIDAASKSIRDNGRAHGFATEKGRANEAMLDSLVTSAHAQAVAMKESGKSAHQVGAYMEGARKKFVSTAIQMGYTRGQAERLATRLYGVRDAANKIPPRKNVNVTANTAAARAALNAFMRDFSNRVIPITASIAAGIHGRADGGMVGGYADGGPVRRFPNGGLIHGPGGPRDDMVPLMASNKEYIVNAKATAENLPLLEAMNSGRTGGASMPASRPVAGGGSGGRAVLEIRSGGSRMDDLLIDVLRGAVRDRGGNVEVVLGKGR